MTIPMLFNFLMSPTKVKLRIFFMFREFEKDIEKKTPRVPFRKVVSRTRKSRKQYSREPLSHV